MKNLWRTLFGVATLLLVTTNLFWFYQMLDNAVANNYYRVGCEEFLTDATTLKNILQTKGDKDEVISYLDNEEVKYEAFEKGDQFVITLGSFDMVFNAENELVLSELR